MLAAKWLFKKVLKSIYQNDLSLLVNVVILRTVWMYVPDWKRILWGLNAIAICLAHHSGQHLYHGCSKMIIYMAILYCYQKKVSFIYILKKNRCLWNNCLKLFVLLVDIVAKVLAHMVVIRNTLNSFAYLVVLSCIMLKTLFCTVKNKACVPCQLKC